jgi:hypothetical protein
MLNGDSPLRHISLQFETLGLPTDTVRNEFKILLRV